MHNADLCLPEDGSLGVHVLSASEATGQWCKEVASFTLLVIPALRHLPSRQKGRYHTRGLSSNHRSAVPFAGLFLSWLSEGGCSKAGAQHSISSLHCFPLLLASPPPRGLSLNRKHAKSICTGQSTSNQDFVLALF